MTNNAFVRLSVAVCVAAIAITTVCQFGCGPAQQLPDSWAWDNDGVQDFAPGPEFKLSREAAVRKAYRADSEAQQAGQ